jgi:hypothetical protein
MRFAFRNPLPIYPATYIWAAYPRHQIGFYTAFFWANDDGRGTLDTFLWTPDRDADSYYGAHPYPAAPPGRRREGTKHHWEISIERDDFVNGAVEYDRWFKQSFRAWGDKFGKHHEFHWNLPNFDRRHTVARTSPSTWGNALPPAPALTWGDAPWAPGEEVWCGVLRGLQIYSTLLSPDEIVHEATTALSTARGAANIWYLNVDPTPDDICDRSGQGNHPEWVGAERPTVWRA